MYHHFRLHVKKFLLILGALVIIALLIILGKEVGLESLLNFMKSHLILGMLIYFGYVVVSTVVIALPVLPVWPVAFYLYGFGISYILTITGSIIGASICFLLARHYGKKMVVKMMGKHLYGEIEHLVKMDNTKHFFIIRLFGNDYFDTLSYIAGLSKISFGKFVTITAIVSSIWFVGLYYLVQLTGGFENVNSVLAVLTIYALVVLIGTVCWEAVHRLHKK